MSYPLKYSKLPLTRDNPMFRSKLFSILLGIGVSIGFAEEDQSVRLDAYSGVGSVLLHWTTAEINSAEAVHIFKSIDRQYSYELIAEVNPDLDRYLDTKLEDGQIAFYYVELVVDENQSIISDKTTPPFGQKLKNDNFEKFGIPFLSNMPSDFQTFRIANIILLEHFEDEFQQLDPIAISFPLANGDFVFQWAGLIPAEEMQTLFQYLSSYSNIKTLKSAWDSKWNSYEKDLRNNMLLTPDEYRRKGDSIITNIIENIIPKHINYLQRDLKFIESSPDIIVKNLIKNNNSIDVSFYALKQISTGTLTLECRLDIIAINLVDITPDSSFTVKMPEDWDFVTITNNGQRLGHFPLNFNSNVITRFLDGSISNYNTVLPFPLSALPTHDADYFWFNEIQYNSHDHSLHIEIAGRSDENLDYGLFFNDDLIRKINTGIQFEQTYFDYVFTLDMENEIGGWLDLKVKVDGEWSTMSETRPIITEESKIEARIPDGGQWQEVTFTTFGEANDFRKANTKSQMIPEVFAMFQNYPNPFNASTSVSIDLIEPAIIDLFITDAAGRKIKEFVQSEALNPGQYSFVWDAHDHSSGVYFLTIVAQMKDFLPVVQSRKMIYLK